MTAKLKIKIYQEKYKDTDLVYDIYDVIIHQ